MTAQANTELLSRGTITMARGRPAADPAPEQIEQLGRELDAIRDEVRADLGERDARYIRRILRLHRTLEVAGRLAIPFSLTPMGFTAGVTCLSLAKIIENMEIGHNVMHGQYDWMNDPTLHSQSYEWDTVCDADSWRRTHNYEHHTYTNIVGKDRDYGYALLRLSDEQAWRPRNLIPDRQLHHAERLLPVGRGRARDRIRETA